MHWCITDERFEAMVGDKLSGEMGSEFLERDGCYTRVAECPRLERCL